MGAGAGRFPSASLCYPQHVAVHSRPATSWSQVLPSHKPSHTKEFEAGRRQRCRKAFSFTDFVILAENKSFPEAPSEDLCCVSLATTESHVQSWSNGGIAVNRLDRAVSCYGPAKRETGVMAVGMATKSMG